MQNSLLVPPAQSSRDLLIDSFNFVYVRKSIAVGRMNQTGAWLISPPGWGYHSFRWLPRTLVVSRSVVVNAVVVHACVFVDSSLVVTAIVAVTLLV